MCAPRCWYCWGRRVRVVDRVRERGQPDASAHDGKEKRDRDPKRAGSGTATGGAAGAGGVVAALAGGRSARAGTFIVWHEAGGESAERRAAAVLRGSCRSPGAECDPDQSE